MIFWICLTGPSLFLIVSLLFGSLTPNFKHSSDEMSYLIYERYGVWQTVNFLVSGILTIGLAYSLSSLMDNSLQSVYLIQASAWTLGLSLLFLRIFPTQPKDQKSYISQIHKSIFVFSVLAEGSFQLLFAMKNPHLSVTPYLLISGVISVVGLIIMFFKKNIRGIAQRFLVGAIIFWVTVGALLLHNQ